MFSKNDPENEKYAEDAESLLSHSDLEEGEERRNTKTGRWASIQHTLLLIFTHFLVAGTAVWLWNYGKPDLNSICAAHTSNYCEVLLIPKKRFTLTCRIAPVLEGVGLKYGEVLYNGSFFHEQIYRKDASPEVDAAWKALGADCKTTRPEKISNTC